VWSVDALWSRPATAALWADGALVLPAGPGAATKVAATPAPLAGGSDAAAPWQAGLDALLRALREPGRRPGALNLNLSAAFVRWHLLPWPARVASPAELDAAVRLRLRAVHGQAVDGWLLQRAEVAPGEPVPVCAIDQALRRDLQRGLAPLGWRLQRLQPYAAAALDHWRALGRRQAAWLAVVEPEHLTLALVAQGRWRALRSVRCHGHDAAAVQAAIAGLQAQVVMSLDPAPAEQTLLYLTGPVAGAHAGAWRGEARWLEPEGAARGCAGAARLAWGQ